MFSYPEVPVLQKKCYTSNILTPHSYRKNQLPACVPPPSPCLSMLRGVNSRGVGEGGSTMVHGYRMCLGGYAAWLPSVRMSHSALLSHFLPLSFCTSSALLSSSHPLNLLSRFLSSFHSASSSAYMATAAA